jgi:hypothetical protein
VQQARQVPKRQELAFQPSARPELSAAVPQRPVPQARRVSVLEAEQQPESPPKVRVLPPVQREQASAELVRLASPRLALAQDPSPARQVFVPQELAAEPQPLARSLLELKVPAPQVQVPPTETARPNNFSARL